MSKKFQTTLSPELQEKARAELGEKEEWRDRDIHALRERVQNNKAFTTRTDSAFFLRFLRARKFDYERSYNLLENYYKIRAENVQHFRDLRPSALSVMLESGVTQVLPKPDKFGRRIIYFRPGKWNIKHCPVFDILRANVLNLEMIVRDEATQVNGIVFLANFDGYGWEQAKNASREYFRLTTSIFQDSFPMRLKSVHVVNEIAILSYIFPIVKPFLKEKILKRLNIYGSKVENLCKEDTGLSKEVLPSELGGDLLSGDELAKIWAKEVMEHEQMFIDMQQYKIELPRNITRSSVSEGTAGDVGGDQGVTGTFRKLNVD